MRDDKGRFIKGHGFTEEMLCKMSEDKLGKPTWNAGTAKPKVKKVRVAWNKGVGMSDEQKAKLSAAKKGKPNGLLGRKVSEESKLKMSLAKLGKSNPLKGVKTGRAAWNSGTKGLMPEPWNKGIKTGVNVNKRRGSTVECPVCLGEFYLPVSRLKKGAKFCSKKCSDKGKVYNGVYKKGDQHPGWIDGNAGNGYPAEFSPALKRIIRERDGHICQLCGMTEEFHKEKFNRVLAVNHIDFNKLNCSEDNLNTLCTGCNTKINWNRDFYTTLFQERLKNKV